MFSCSNPQFDCSRVNICTSVQCPLNPDHDVNVIHPGNECRLSINRRLLIANNHPKVTLMYFGMTGPESRDRLDRMIRKEATFAREARISQATLREKARVEAKTRADLLQRFKDLTEGLPTNELLMLIDDIDSVLRPKEI